MALQKYMPPLMVVEKLTLQPAEVSPMGLWTWIG